MTRVKNHQPNSVTSPDKIRSVADLKRAKERLKQEIQEQEELILDHPLLTVPKALFRGTSVRNSLEHSLKSISLENYKKGLFSLLSTLLLANKRTRAFYIAFVIAKEMVPYAFEKAGDLFNSELNTKAKSKR